MTQEEKAIQIAKNLVGKLDDQLCSGVVEKSALYGALNMANWQKEQMMKDAIPAKVVNDGDSGCVIDCEYGCLYLPSHAYDFTDKLKIIIVKEEENESNKIDEWGLG